MKSAFVITALVGLLAFTVAVSALLWRELSDVALGVHGWVALISGMVLTLAVGVGLVRLMRYSQRHGHDDRQQ